MKDPRVSLRFWKLFVPSYGASNAPCVWTWYVDWTWSDQSFASGGGRRSWIGRGAEARTIMPVWAAGRKADEKLPWLL